MSKFAWVTLATNDTYSLGALVLAHSLKRVSTIHQLAVLVTPGVSESMRNKLKDVCNVVQEVNVLDSQDSANLALLARPELGVTFTKLHCWRLVQFEKCVFLDADTLILQNCDELFEREELSAAPDVSWPDCFNSGVFVYRPSLETFDKITQFAVKQGSFDGGDQGLLNQYFSDWAHKDISKHLPFTYNTTAYASYCYLPAYKQFRDRIKILHFAGKLKPWLITFNSQSKTAVVPSEYQHAADLIQLWWNIFCDNVHQKLTSEMNHLIKEFQHTYPASAVEPVNIQTYTNVEYKNPPNNIHVFHDPWEDYYENMEKDKNNVTVIEEPAVEPFQSTDHFEERFEHLDKEVEHEQSSSFEIIQDSSDSESDCTSISYCTSHQSENIGMVVENVPIHVEERLEEIYDYHQEEPLVEGDHNNCSNLCEISQLTSIEHESNPANETQSVEEQKDSNEAGLAGALSTLRLGENRTPEQEAYEHLMRRQCWEAGNIDYTGRDSFENIWKKISQTLESKPVPATTAGTSNIETQARSANQ